MKIKHMITTIDTHTEGGPTRIITSGVGPLAGKTMAEKKDYFGEHFEDVRELLMKEPRGHAGMFGAVLTEPVNAGAELGVFFLTGAGYLDMCVHSAMGVAAAALETGMIPAGRKSIKLDTPAGVISLAANYEGDRLASITIRGNPAYVHSLKAEVDIGLARPAIMSLVFSAVFFVLLDAKQWQIEVRQENIPALTDRAVKVLEKVNQTLEFAHPENPEIKTAQLAMLYEDRDDACACNAVISQGGVLDRSPCGAGTGAKMAYLFARKKLKLKEQYVSKGVFGTQFTGQLIETVSVGQYAGVVGEITGSAYITGFHQFIRDEFDK